MSGLSEFERQTILGLARLEAKLDRMIGGPEPELISVKAMAIPGCRSTSAFYRLMDQLGVHPIVYGKYRRRELENAIARKALDDRLAPKQSGNGQS